MFRLLRRVRLGHPQQKLQTRFLQGLGAGLGVGLAFGFMNFSKLKLDAVQDTLNKVDAQPKTKNISEFPRQVNFNKTNFQLLATGVRSVTFLNFHVYAVGLYIAHDDLTRAQNVLAQQKLQSEEIGTECIDALLSAKVRFAIRLTPTRTTDYNHLRDGFVRSIMNQKEAKQFSDASFGEGIAEIKRAFSRKKKLSKDEVIAWVMDGNGMTAYYGDDEVLGYVNDFNATKLFFMQYLTGPKPNSPSLRDNAVKGLEMLRAL